MTLHDDEEALFAAVRELFNERIPFNMLLGFEIDSISFESARVRFDFREELVGNILRKSLHGGAVSAVLDLAGGIVAFLSAARTRGGELDSGETGERSRTWGPST